MPAAKKGCSGCCKALHWHRSSAVVPQALSPELWVVDVAMHGLKGYSMLKAQCQHWLTRWQLDVALSILKNAGGPTKQHMHACMEKSSTPVAPAGGSMRSIRWIALPSSMPAGRPAQGGQTLPCSAGCAGKTSRVREPRTRKGQAQLQLGVLAHGCRITWGLPSFEMFAEVTLDRPGNTVTSNWLNTSCLLGCRNVPSFLQYINTAVC